MSVPTVADVKANLILEGTADDGLISSLISAAVSYAEDYQHLGEGYYTTIPAGATTAPAMPASTHQAIVMLASRWYESRDGGSGGFYADRADVGQYADEVVHRLLRMNRAPEGWVSA